jgi:hypothetical protein
VEKHRETAPDRLFILSRYQIENYLLDEDLIVDLLTTIFQRTMSRDQVRSDLFEIVRSNSAAFLRDLTVYRYGELYQAEDCSIGNHSSGMAAILRLGQTNTEVVEPLQKALFERVSEVNTIVSSRIAETNIERIFAECLDEVKSALEYQSEEWKKLFPGRYILERFSSKHNLGDWPALQNLLIDRLSKGDLPIDRELREIFEKIVG